MLPAIPILIGGLATAIINFMKHPIITKMLIFSFFVGVISYAISYLKDFVYPYVVSNSALSLAGYLGVLDGLSLFITIIVLGFGVKQVLAFIRS